MVEDGLRAYIPAVRRLVLDTIAAGGELLTRQYHFTNTHPAREILFVLMCLFYLIPNRIFFLLFSFSSTTEC